MGLVTPVDPVGLSELGRVHFIGIGGAGMSGIARIMLARGVAVSGSDSAGSDMLAGLAALGARVHVGHAAANLGDADTIVVSTAIRESNPELAEARRRGLRVLHRAAALASVMLGQRGIAVAGTHGKTTSTSMLTTVLRECGADPSYVIGGILAGTGLGADEGSGDIFVAEADESDGSFLMLSPEAAIVTCVEADHLDNYPGLAEIEAAFAAFTRRIRPGGLLVTCADDPGAAALAAAVRAAAPQAVASGALPIRVRSYGESADADYRVSGVVTRGMAISLDVTGSADGPLGNEGLFKNGGVRVDLRVPGRHNALNAAAVFALAAELGFPAGQIASGLAAYRGALRRLELKGEADGVRVLDSYAHHPTEVTADLRAARDIAEGGRVIVVFQPHLFSRTRIFATALGEALGLADEVLVLDVYAAREDPEPGVSGELVASRVPGGRARYLPDPAGVAGAVAAIGKPGDLVLTMGAGDVTALGPLIVAALHARAGAGG
ncbi:MAG: UDP-N-acetylmuramate--alanine ligase [Streptosporangiaceae bacterium]|jgi:UDP-N-acetylmuramate--alanine ligase|nr:UDP-N-acetylmuramate--alanine ligase [Streptosporangiaceae bacterium]